MFLISFMFHIIFLVVLMLIWLVFAVIQDLRTREIANWLNFSLIVFALGFRFFYELFSDINFVFFYQGLLGLGIFFVLGTLLYYGRIFAGGDAKLMMSLGRILPFFKSFFFILIIFLIGLLFMGFGFREPLLFFFGFFIFVIPYLFIFAKSIDESCMIKKIKPKFLREGDWLYK